MSACSRSEDSTVDGKPGPITHRQQRCRARCSLTAGTKIERADQVSILRGSMPNLKKDGELTADRSAGPGYPERARRLQVAPEQKNIDVTSLDLAADQGDADHQPRQHDGAILSDKAPNHVRNFIKLSKSGFYDGTRFHRVIRNFMIQGGCPNTKAGATGAPGTGNPGYTVDAEFGNHRHTKGVLSMARGSDINSAGCQFFICHGDASALDNKYTAFGELVEGMPTLDKIADVRVTANNHGETSVPTQPVHLYKALVLPVFAK